MTTSGNLYPRPTGFFQDDHWRLSFSLTVGLHLLVLAASLLPSSIFYSRPEVPEVVTINLFAAEELTQPKPAVKKEPPPEPVVRKEAPPPPPAPEPPARETISIIKEQPAPEPVPGPPPEVISLTPRVTKKKVDAPEKSKMADLDARRLNALERIRAKVAQARKEEQVKHDLATIRETLHETRAKTAAPPASEATAADSAASQNDGRSDELMDKALQRYYLAVSRQIHEHWVLPKMQNWSDSLESLVVIVVNRNGTITRSFFEKKSENSYFDQFVEKTIQEAAPMPQFPADITSSQLEIGLIFHPSGLM